jgi:peptidylprolyl isomerase
MPSLAAPADVAANPANKLTLELSNGGTVVIQMRPDLAPHHVERVQTLVRQGFYNGLTFHRVIPGFMAQGGDPKGTGEGGSSLPDLKAEFTAIPFLRGTVAAARLGDNPDSSNSQFFIMFVPNPSLDGQYSVWGRVISGMDAVDAIAPGEPPAEPTKIVRAYLGDMAAPPAK